MGRHHILRRRGFTRPAGNPGSVAATRLFRFRLPMRMENRIGTHPGNALCRDNDAWRAKGGRENFLHRSRNTAHCAVKQTDEVNQACRRVNLRTREDVSALLDDGKKVVLLGGYLLNTARIHRSLAERHDSFSILHIDAHADLRDCYEGFEYSHASVMFNAYQATPSEKSNPVQEGEGTHRPARYRS